MQKYRVGILEIWIRTVVLEAEDRNDALVQAESFKEEEEESFAFYAYVPTEEWPVEETEPMELFVEAMNTIDELTAALKSVGVPETSSFFYRSNALAQRMAAAYERTTGRPISD